MTTDNVVQIPERPQSKTDDPLREIFRKPLGRLSSAEIRQGVGLLEARLKAMDGALKALEVRVKREVLGALGADSDEGVQRLKRELADHRSARDVMALALESAREQFLVARERERRSELERRRAAIEALIEERSAWGQKAEAAADQLLEALAQCWRIAQQVQPMIGSRVPSSTIAALRPDHVRHLVEMHFARHDSRLWPYDRMPATVMPQPLGRLIHADGLQLLADLDEAMDLQARRGADQDAAELDASNAGEAPPEPEAA
ncbi:MAG: hypothetical protein ACOZDY_18535 [Pseudomonadota bacterium]